MTVRICVFLCLVFLWFLILVFSVRLFSCVSSFSSVSPLMLPSPASPVQSQSPQVFIVPHLVLFMLIITTPWYQINLRGRPTNPLEPKREDVIHSSSEYQRIQIIAYKKNKFLSHVWGMEGWQASTKVIVYVKCGALSESFHWKIRQAEINQIHRLQADKTFYLQVDWKHVGKVLWRVGY